MKNKILTAALTAILSISFCPSFSADVSAEWVKYDNGYGYTNEKTGDSCIGWQDIGRQRYYFNDDGIMCTGWQKIDGKTYYFGKNGAMRTGRRKIGGKTYDFGMDGALKTKSSGKTSVTADNILNAIKKEAGDGYSLDMTCGKKELEDIGFDTSYVESFAYEINSSCESDIAVIVKMKRGYGDYAAEVLQNYFEQLYEAMEKENFDLYSLEQARLFRSGDYAALIILGGCAEDDLTDEEKSDYAVCEALNVDKAWKDIFGSVPKNLAEISDDLN